MKKVENEISLKIDILPEEERIEKNIEVSSFSQIPIQLESESDLNEKTIKYIERMIRNSFEYRSYISFLKNELDLTKCALLDGIDTKELKVSLEFHHFPLTLYDIVEIIGNHKLNNLGENETVSCFDIAEEVMAEHYRNNIGLVPLTKTLHEMAHTRSIVIPLNKINGNYKNFIKKYEDDISDSLKDILFNYQVNNNTEESFKYNKEKLKKRVVDYNIEYND